MVISENVGHDMTFSILNTTTNKFIIRSNIRPAGESTFPNLRIDLLTTPDVITSRRLHSAHLEDKTEAPAVAEGEIPNASNSTPKHNMPVLDPNYLVGRTFLIPQEDGQLLRARIFNAVDD